MGQKLDKHIISNVIDIHYFIYILAVFGTIIYDYLKPLCS